MGKPLGVALLGYGLSGRVFHLPFLRVVPELKVEYINSSRVAEISAIDPAIKVVQDTDLILSDPKVEVVINTLPNKYHYEISKKALLAGKHVIVEKPFVNSVDEGLDLIETAKKNNVLLTVFHNRRWDGDFLTIQETLKQNTLGEVKLFESRFDRFKPTLSSGWRDQPQPGSGVFFDLAPHLVDQAITLFGYPTHVSADILSQRPGALVDDYFELSLHYGSSRAILRSSSLICHQTPRFQIFGTKGSMISVPLDPQERLLKESITPYSEHWKMHNESVTSDLYQTFEGGGTDRKVIKNRPGDYGAFFSGFADAVANQKTPPVDPLEALNVINIIKSGFESAQNGSKVPFRPITL